MGGEQYKRNLAVVGEGSRECFLRVDEMVARLKAEQKMPEESEKFII